MKENRKILLLFVLCLLFVGIDMAKGTEDIDDKKQKRDIGRSKIYLAEGSEEAESSLSGLAVFNISFTCT